MQNAALYSEASRTAANVRAVLGVLEAGGQLMTWTGQPEVVLDAGCGPGDVTALVLRPWLPPGSLLLGADVSPAMVARATARHGDPPHLAFAVADLDSPRDTRALLDASSPLYQHGFTKIVSVFVLHWLQDLTMGVSNLYALLRPGGDVLLAFPVDRMTQKTFAKMRASQRWRDYFKGVDRQIPSFPREDAATEFKEMLHNAGFEVVKCDVDYLHSDYDSVDQFRDLLESLDPDLKRVPPHLKEDYLDECVQNFKNLGALTVLDQGCRHAQLFLTCIARKPMQYQDQLS